MVLIVVLGGAVGCSSATPRQQAARSGQGCECTESHFWKEQAFPTVSVIAGDVAVENLGGQPDPLPEALVLVTGENGFCQRTFSNKSGRFKMQGLEPGVYRLVICKEGYQGVMGNVEIRDEAPQTPLIIRVGYDA